MCPSKGLKYPCRMYEGQGKRLQIPPLFLTDKTRRFAIPSTMFMGGLGRDVFKVPERVLPQTLLGNIIYLLTSKCLNILLITRV